MDDKIFLKDVQKVFDATLPDGKPMPFDIEVFTFSKTNKSGGNLKSYNNVTKATRSDLKKSNYKKSMIDKLFDDRVFKNPNHFKNRTRCIRLATGEIRKISFIMIKTINNKEMIY